MPSETPIPAEQPATKPRLINCHTHIFTADHVPPLLGRKLLPWGVYYLAHLGFIVRIFRWWFNSKWSPYKWRFYRWHKLLTQALYIVKISTSRYFIWGLVKTIVGIIILASAFHELYHLGIRDWLLETGIKVQRFDAADQWLIRMGILVITESILLRLLLLIILLTFFPTGRNLLWFVLRKFGRFFRMLPGKQTTELIKRYINIVRFARYKDQYRIFAKLMDQYPKGSAMIVLPMDMAFMNAGSPPSDYGSQMEDLAKLKKNRPEDIYPFIFVDPRRTRVGEQVFFDYDTSNGKVILKDCFIKDYIEEKAFSGFKIYPALGYYPFDEALLPLWKYAADNGIPILTHCIRGTIYYRGKKKKEWDTHPVFEQYEGDQDDDPLKEEYFKPLRLPQMKPVEVQEIFTHPMNYACLLKKPWLAKLVANAKDDRIRTLFGYDAQTGTISEGLEHLKICFGHFGGEDEWLKFFERDREVYAAQLVRYPDRGIDFVSSQSGNTKSGKQEFIWKFVDWYSIICSLMLQHENVYADISYILHGDAQILPLLRQTLRHPRLRKQVLFGTDFYVVRNHKSDKNMLADMMCGLSEDEFDQVARVNPVRFLKRSTD